MLETIAVILIILWLLGLVSSYTMGGFIHILLGHCGCGHPGSCSPGSTAVGMTRGCPRAAPRGSGCAAGGDEMSQSRSSESC